MTRSSIAHACATAVWRHQGKTFVLNQITNVTFRRSRRFVVCLPLSRVLVHLQSNLPSGKKISTKGLSFKVGRDPGCALPVLMMCRVCST